MCHHTYSPFSLVLWTLTIPQTRSNILQLKHFNSSISINGDIIAEISVTDPSEPSTSTNNTLAYRSNVTELHQSRLAGVFLNFEEIFPCASGQFPICCTFTYEEDGFLTSPYGFRIRKTVKQDVNITPYIVLVSMVV